MDALYEKTRYDGRVVTMAVLVVAGITLEGARDILTAEPMLRESEETYRELFEGLKKRGIKDVWLCISNCHQGLKAVIHPGSPPGGSLSVVRPEECFNLSGSNLLPK